ncbi:MAG: type II toxin-antitoxin system RelE family toxin [Terracidiphilus sp.]
MSWDVRVAKQAAKALDKLPKAVWPRIARAIDELEADPHQGDVLSLLGSEWKGCYRKRVRPYRVIFSLDHAACTVTVLDVLRRSEKTYR